MEILTQSLNSAKRQTQATMTAYLQTPTPNSEVQTFDPLLIIPVGSMTHIPEEEPKKGTYSPEAIAGFLIAIPPKTLLAILVEACCQTLGFSMAFFVGQQKISPNITNATNKGAK